MLTCTASSVVRRRFAWCRVWALLLMLGFQVLIKKILAYLGETDPRGEVLRLPGPRASLRLWD